MKTRGRKVIVPPDWSEDEDLSDDDEYMLPPKRDIEQSDDDEEDDECNNYEHLGLGAVYVNENCLAEATDNLNKPSTSKVVKKPKLTWIEKSIDFEKQDIAFLGCEDLPDEILNLETPMSFFKLLFTTEALDLINDQSKLYAEQIDPEKANSVTRDDNISKFIGIIIYMSVVQLPAIRHYWREGTYIEKVASILTCNKFEQIKRFLHYIQNLQSKILYLLQQVRLLSLS